MQGEQISPNSFQNIIEQFSENLFKNLVAHRSCFLTHTLGNKYTRIRDEPIEQQVKAAHGLSINSYSASNLLRAFHPSPNFRQRARRHNSEARGERASVIIIIWTDSAWIRQRREAAARYISACVIRKVAKCSVTLLYARTKAAE